MDPFMPSNPSSPSPSPTRDGLSQMVEAKLRSYFQNLGSLDPATNLYDLIIREVEKPLLEMTLEFCQGNKSKASQILGLNRNTLHKKLQDLSS
jgi:two-component system nitrogen regulation response regulator GlnG